MHLHKQHKKLGFLLPILLLSGCAMNLTPDYTYQTYVTGNGDSLGLSFAPKYPFLNALRSGIKLRASYRVNGVKRSEVLSTSRLYGTRAYFKLPRKLGAVPDNHVCLQFEPLRTIRTRYGNIDMIPVRSTIMKSGQNNVAFRYPAWDALISTNGKLKAAEAKLQKLENLQRHYQQNTSSYRTDSDCDRIKPKTTKIAEPIVQNPARFSTAAKHVCVYRAQSLNTLSGGKFYADRFVTNFDLTQLSPKLQEKAKVFRRDWSKYTSTVRAPGYRPEHGLLKDKIFIDSAQLHNPKKLKRKLTKSEDRYNLINIYSQYADLYDVCKSDVSKQLAIRLENWEERKIKQKQEDAELYKMSVLDCKQKVRDTKAKDEKLNKLTVEKASIQAELERLKSSAATLSLPNERVFLNRQHCAY